MYPTKNELAERYERASDEKLLYIVHNPREYTTDAVDVAKGVLAERDITVAQVETFVEEQEYRRLEKKLASLIPLTFFEKAFYFFLSLFAFFLGSALRLNYRDDGMTLKLKQSKYFSLTGFICFMLDVAISVYLDLGNGPSLFILAAFFLIALLLEKRMPYHEVVKI